MAVSWPVGVNTDAYGMDTSPIENVERIQFESGKERTYLKNSVGRKAHSFMLSMRDDGAGSEYRTFVAWYDSTLLSGALTFMFPDLVIHTGLREYALIEYSASGQLRKELTLTVEEA